MKTRMNYFAKAPDLLQKMVELNKAVDRGVPGALPAARVA